MSDTTVVKQNPYDQVKANIQCTHCIVCKQRFEADQTRSNAYKDSIFIGVMHEDCYEAYAPI